MQIQSLLQHTVLQNSFLLSPSRVIFWEEEKILILSDLHFGKSGHFRKAGIAIPQNILQEDIIRFLDQVQYFKPLKIIIVGDLFHSNNNKEHLLFLKLRQQILQIEVHLIMGNHDILQQKFYEEARICVHQKVLKINNFIFAHDISDLTLEADKYYFSGHIHPSIIIKGLGKQQIVLPCFYFKKAYAVLPAFGKFTGNYIIKPNKSETVFSITHNKIIKM